MISLWDSPSSDDTVMNRRSGLSICVVICTLSAPAAPAAAAADDDDATESFGDPVVEPSADEPSTVSTLVFPDLKRKTMAVAATERMRMHHIDL